MKSAVPFFLALWLILINYSHALRQDDMDSLQGSVYLYSPSMGSLSSGILKSHSGFWYTANRNKTVYVSAATGYSILVSIKVIDLRPSKQDSLKLFSVNGQITPATYYNKNYFIKDRKYYSREEEIYFVPNGQLGITFSTGPIYNTNGYDGFELTYTAQSNYLQCDPGDFHCNNGRCIARVLKCDRHNHCGDGSSLKNCSSSSSPGRTAGIICGIIFLSIAVACGVYIVIRRARNSTTESHTVITSHPPPSTNLPSYPPAYPQPGTYYPPPPPPYSQGISNPTYH